MAKSRSESLLREAEIPHFARNRLRNLKGFAKGKTVVPGPGKGYLTVLPRPRWERIEVGVNGQPDMRQA